MRNDRVLIPVLHVIHNAKSGLIFGRFYSRYSVIFPMPNSIFFSQFLEENSQFQILKFFLKTNHQFF